MNAKIAAAISLGASSLALIGSISIANAANAATTTTDTSNHPAARVESISDTGFNAVSNVMSYGPEDFKPQTVNSPVAGNESGKTQANPGSAGASQTSSNPSASTQGKADEKKEDQGSVTQAGGKDSKTPPEEAQKKFEKDATEKFKDANKYLNEATASYNPVEEEVTKTQNEADEAIQSVNSAIEKKTQAVAGIEKAKKDIAARTQELKDAQGENKKIIEENLQNSRRDLERTAKDASDAMNQICSSV